MKARNPMSFQRNRGFTLVEISIVLIVLAILAAVVIPQFSSARTDPGTCIAATRPD